MNRSGFFFLLIAICVAVTTIWLNSTWVNFKYFQLPKKERKIDYYLSNFTLLNVQEDGKMRYLVTGKHLINQQSSGASEIINPVLEARNADDTVTLLTAKKAIQEEKNGDIILQGSVIINKESNNPAKRFYLQTSNLSYNPVDKELHSDSKVLFKSVNGYLQGTGFSSKLDDQELRIHSNVQAKYQP